MPASLEVRLFGPIQLTSKGELLPPFPTRKCQELFTYLVLHHDRPQARPTLAGLFWPDYPEDKARASLSTTLWRIRQTLGETTVQLELTRDHVTLQITADTWIDVLTFEQLVQRGDAAALAEAVRLYQGELFEGCYEDWCLLERQRLLNHFLSVLECLTGYHEARGEYSQAVAYAKRLLGYDPLREEIHRTLMRLHIAAGDRPAALAQYRACQEALQTELDIEPMPATQALYRQIQKDPTANSSWDERLEGASTVTKNRLDELRRARKYDPELYVPRPALDKALEASLGNGANGMIIIGPSGAGKSNWLAHLAETRLAETDLVLFYQASALTLNVESDLARDAWGSSFVSLVDGLASLGRAAAERGKFVWLLIDGLNEFHDLGAGPADLLRRIDRVIAHLDNTANGSYPLKIVITCRDHTWRLMEIIGHVHLNWRCYHTGQPLVIGEFTPTELEAAYARYRRRFQLGTPLETLPEQMARNCRHPLLLRLMAEVWAGKQVPTIGIGINLFRAYFDRLVPRGDDRQFATALAGRLAEEGQISISLETLSVDPAFQWGFAGAPDCSYDRLCEAGVLLESGPEYAPRVAFTYDRLFEYQLAQHFLAQRQSGAMKEDYLEGLARAAWDYPPLWGAALTILLLTKEHENFTRLASSELYEGRELAVEGLVSLHGENSILALDIARRILNLDSLEAKRVALKAAGEIGAVGYEIFRAGTNSPADRTRRATTVSLFLLWHRNTTTALDILARFVEETNLRTILASPQQVQTLIQIFSALCRYDIAPDSMERLSELVHVFAVRKLHLPRAGNTGATAELIRRMLSRNSAMWPANTDVLDEVFTPGSLNAEQKETYQLVLDNLRQGGREVGADALSSLRILYDAGVDAARITANYQLTIWLHLRPAIALPIIESLFDEGDSLTRLWLLLAFLPLSAPTPAPFPVTALNTLERLTKRLAIEDGHTFRKGLTRGVMATGGPMSFVPLGLRYCQAGQPDFPLLDSLLGKAVQQPEVVGSYLRLLAPVGWSHPTPVLDRIAAATDFQDQVPEPTLEALGMIRALNPDIVERFLLRVGASESLKRRVRLSVDGDRITQWSFLVASNDLRISSLILGAPFGRWVTDSVLAGYLECSNTFEAARRFGDGLFDAMLESDWKLKLLLGLGG